MKNRLQLAAILLAGLLFQPASVVAGLWAFEGQTAGEAQSPGAPHEQGAPGGAAFAAGPPPRDSGWTGPDPEVPLGQSQTELIASTSERMRTRKGAALVQAHGRHLYLTTRRLRL